MITTPEMYDVFFNPLEAALGVIAFSSERREIAKKEYMKRLGHYTANEIEDAAEHFLTTDASNGKFPKIHEVKKYIDSQRVKATPPPQTVCQEFVLQEKADKFMSTDTGQRAMQEGWGMYLHDYIKAGRGEDVSSRDADVMKAMYKKDIEKIVDYASGTGIAQDLPHTARQIGVHLYAGYLEKNIILANKFLEHGAPPSVHRPHVVYKGEVEQEKGGQGFNHVSSYA